MTADHFGIYMNGSKVLSYEEAKEHLDMSTSSGAPFNVHYPTKAELFEKDPEIDQWLQDDWETMNTDPNWSCLFTNSLKEELRTCEKMHENSIRTFLSGGVDAVIHGTRLFVDQNERMYASHLLSASAVGMSPLKGNWDDLFRKLNVFKSGFALDESQYDSSLRNFLMWGCARLRWKMLREKDRTLSNYRRILVYYRNLVNTIVIGPDGVLIMKQTGNPSGSVNTITDNTLILYTLLAYAWLGTVPADMQNLKSFEHHTAKALVGDDNTWTVSEEALVYYNARSVIAEWKIIGVTTTTDSLEPRPASELDFLSAHTVFLKGKAVPIYNRTKLMTSLLYAPAAHLTPAITLERTAAMLSIGWTDLPFRRFCREVIEWLLEKYDRVMRDDPRWITAKCQIKSDESYECLFLGKHILRPQSLSGSTVKLSQPDKRTMNSSKPQRNGTKPGKKTRKSRRVNRKLGGQPRVEVIVERKQRPKRKQNRLAGPGKMAPTKQGGLNKRSCTIQEHEFIYDVVGNGTNFGVVNGGNPFPLNPGQTTTFPWLAGIAQKWERYMINYLEIDYQREVSEFATAGTIGKVMMHIDLDAADSAPTTKQQVLDCDSRLMVSGMPCENFRKRIAGSIFHPSGNPLYLRPGGLPGASDIKTYDAGNLWITTSGTSDNSTKLGELHIRYSITLSVPILEANALAPPINNSVVFATSASLTLTSTVVGTFLWPAVQVINGLGATLGSANGQIILPAGNYLIDSLTLFAAGGLVTNWTSVIQKDAVTVSLAPAVTLPSGLYPSQVLTDTLYVTSNGSNVFTFLAYGTFSTSTLTASGQIRITAI
jgi:hypothetical protein